MTILLRLIFSTLLALATLLLIQLLSEGQLSVAAVDPIALIITFIACALAALVSPLLGVKKGSRNNTNTGSKTTTKSSSKAAPRGDREHGTVKWFNVSKGYGFVTRANGDDIFVHFRSIRGEGRRLLREGQSIEFSVIQGDKGPQAEDVQPL
ncbi:MAG: CspA family cold shock protein [Paraglaciecola psychrophila]|jgi:CspA family cold shock protein